MGWRKRRDAERHTSREETSQTSTERSDADADSPGGTLVAERPAGEPGGVPGGAPGSGPAGGSAHEPAHEPAGESTAERRSGVVRHWWLLLLVRAAHPRQALATALAFGVAAVLAGRATREVLVVMATVLVGQAILGWHNDLVDRGRDHRHRAGTKPLTTDHLETGTVWFAVVCGALLVVPLSISTGLTAGLAYLAALVVALGGHHLLRRGALSWVPWALSFGLYPAYLSYGGWGGQALGSPPGVTMTVLAALLGVGVHVLLAVYALVEDHQEGWRTLPVRLGLRLGAGRLLALATGWTVVVVLAMALVGSRTGLTG